MLSSFVKRNSRQRIERCSEPQNERVGILLPVLNEAARIERCLDGLMVQPNEVSEILVVDGGSTDETQSLVQRYQRSDRRIRWVDASPVDERWTGNHGDCNSGC